MEKLWNERRSANNVQKLSQMSENADTLGNIIRGRRRHLGLSQQDLAAAVASTKGYISMIERDKVAPPSVNLLRRFERALTLPEGRLIRPADWRRTPDAVRLRLESLAAEDDDAQRGAKLRAWLAEQGAGRRADGCHDLDAAFAGGSLATAERPPATASPATATAPRDTATVSAHLPVPQRVPVINRVAAGLPSEFTDLDYPAAIADEYTTCLDLDDPSAFAARISGDSMEPAYREGDIVVFSPRATVTDGCDCFIRLEPDHQTTFKRVFFDAARPHVIHLVALNTRYARRTVDREQVTGLWKAVLKQQRL